MSGSGPCLGCDVAKARRANAILRVPKVVPNPRFVEREQAGLPTEGRKALENPVRLPDGTWRTWIWWSIPKTIPNPDFDRLTRVALNMSEVCSDHADLAEARLSNALLQAQAKAEMSMELVRELAKNRKLKAGKGEILPVVTVQSVFPLGYTSQREHDRTPLADGVPARQDRAGNPVLPITAPRMAKPVPSGGRTQVSVGGWQVGINEVTGLTEHTQSASALDPAALARPASYVPAGKRKARPAIPVETLPKLRPLDPADPLRMLRQGWTQSTVDLFTPSKREEKR